MNVSIAKTYFDKNGFIFIATDRKKENLTEIKIAKFTDFDLAFAYFKNDATAEFMNLTQAKQKGWIE